MDSSGLPLNHRQQQHQLRHQLHRPPPPRVFPQMHNNAFQQPPIADDSGMHRPNNVYPFNSVPSAAVPPQPMNRNIFQADGPSVGVPPNPMDQNVFQTGGASSGGDGGGFVGEAAKKKRGRPRKVAPDNGIGLGLSPARMGGMAHNESGGGGTPSTENNTVKRNRGRPLGSVKKQLNALGVPGTGFAPHVITVNQGEDIALKIVDFSKQGPRTVIILSATGAVYSATLSQQSMAGGTVTYEGRFDIISLSGSFRPLDNNGNNHRTGGLSVLLAASDGKVMGGGVAGMLKAASSVQVVVGSFIANGKKQKSEAPSSSAPPMLHFDGPNGGTNFSPVNGLSDSEEENEDTPPAGPYSQPSVGVHNTQMYPNMGYSMKMHPN